MTRLARVLARFRRQPTDRCKCGHPWSAHQHYRAGTNCGLCTCPRYA